MSKNNLVVTGSNFVEVIGNAVTDYANKLGYEFNKVELDEEGKALMPIYDSENKCILETRESVPADVLTAVNSINAVSTLNQLEGVILAHNCAILRNHAENNGFKSVGKFINEVCPKVSPNYANQLVNVADLFIIEDETGAPVWKYDWCKGASVSNLALMLPIVNKCENVHEFIVQYIDGDILHPRKAQGKFKDELSAVRGKSEKKSEKKSESKSEASATNDGTMPIETAVAVLYEDVLQRIATEQDDDIKAILDYIRQGIEVIYK